MSRDRKKRKPTQASNPSPTREGFASNIPGVEPTSKVEGVATKANSSRKKTGWKGPKFSDRSKTEVPDSFSTSNSQASSTSKFWPKHKASALTAGNYIENAGQENFIEDFSRIHDKVGGVPLVTRFSPAAKRTPNAMRLDLQTYFGATANNGFATSAINQAVLFIKQFIDTNLGSQQSYDPQDLAPYFMAVADCFTLIAEIKRDIKLLVTQMVQWPYFVPSGLLDLLEICSPDAYTDPSVPFTNSAANYYRRHIRSLADRLNLDINLFNGLPIPMEMPLFGYNDDLFECIYTDADSSAAQYYVFATTGTWKYEEDSNDPDDPGARVIYYEWPKHSEDSKRWKTLDQMLDRLEEMIAAITAYRTSSSALIQNLRNAYGTNRLRTIEPLEVGALSGVPFKYDPLMLISIENAAIQNQVWPCGFLASAVTNSLVGCPFIVDHRDTLPLIQGWAAINLPLQFHCKPTEISQEMIGLALRFHPAFQVREYATVVTASHPSGIFDNVISTGGCFGFGIIQSAAIGIFGDSGFIESWPLNTRVINEFPSALRSTMINLTGDFAQAPLLVEAYIDRETINNAPQDSMYVATYTGKRDVELTLRFDEMQQWWIGITEYAWGTNVSHDIRGSRAVL